MSTVIFDEYKERLERRRRKPVTVYNFVVAAQRFSAWCEERGIDPTEPEPIVIEEYFDELSLSPSTKGAHLKQLRAAYSYALTRGVIRRDPTVDVELPREADKTPRVITMDHLRTAKELCTDDRYYLMFHLFAYTGARLHEVLKMTWEDISLENRTIQVIGKGGKLRLVPIHPALGELLAAGGEGLVFPGRSGNPMVSSTGYYWLAKILPGYSFHDFRRTVASSLDANGVSRSEIDEIMGWARRGIFERYYRNVAGERLQQAILRLYANDPL